MTQDQDAYDLAECYLRNHPDELKAAWLRPNDHPYGYVFAFVEKTRYYGTPKRCGCLTMIRNGSYDAETVELTEEIREDKRIPVSFHGLIVEDIPVFCEWQRRIDKILDRVPPIAPVTF